MLLPSYTSTWAPPTELPRLTDAQVIALDCETFDPNLSRKQGDPKRSPGWATCTGYVVGVSVATPEQAWYVPIRNALGQTGNHCPEKVTEWLQDSLGSDTPKVGANLTYDVGWLGTMGIDIRGVQYDVQHAESLLTDTGRVNLDYLGTRYVGEGKDSSDLYTWCSAAYGGAPDQKQRSNIYRAPMELVGPYAESDARLPLQILQQQWPVLASQGLLDVFDMECRLIPLLVAMRRRGVRVDVERAHAVYHDLTQRATVVLRELEKIAGREISVNSGTDLGLLCDKLGITYNRTPSTDKPQFVKKWMAEHAHPIMKQILEARELLKLGNTFCKSYIIDSNVDGVVHATFNQLKATDGGAKTGRFSSSAPNVQNIPIRSELAKLIRQIFVPFPGDSHWLKVDYSQIEYRCLAHFAVGDGAHDVVAAYLRDARTDYHKLTQQLVLAMTGQEIARGPIKNINFGILYGMGIRKLAVQLGITFNDALATFKAYHKGAPYVNSTMRATMDEAQEFGYITTILGRRTRFDQWAPKGRDNNHPPLPFHQALKQYGAHIERAFLYRALNYRLQGSAADIMKRAMVNGWESGLFDRLSLPTLTVHDELGFSLDAASTDPALLAELRDCMEHAIPLRVPVIADFEAGPDWGRVEPVRLFA